MVQGERWDCWQHGGGWQGAVSQVEREKLPSQQGDMNKASSVFRGLGVCQHVNSAGEVAEMSWEGKLGPAEEGHWVPFDHSFNKCELSISYVLGNVSKPVSTSPSLP